MTIEVTTLPNGLRVASDSMDTVETVSLGVWVDVGARHEPEEINGISHLLEHMAFKGTERRSAQDIAIEIEDVGGHLNAYTSRENTAYFAKVLKDDAPLALDIIADILQNSVFDPEELQREQAVVVQEINQAVDIPDDIIFDHFQSVAYPNQALGRPVLGTAEVVRSVSRDTIITYMHDRYRAPRMVLAAAGRIEHAHLLDMAEGAFSSLSAQIPAIDETAHYRGGDFRESRDLEQVHLVLGFDGIAYEDPDFYASSILSGLLGGGMSSRLFQEIREKRGLAYNIYSFASSYQDGGLFAIYAGTGEDDVEELIPLLCDEIVKVTQGISDDEVRRSRAQIKAGILMGLESTSSRCEQLARQLLVFGRPIPSQEVVAKVEAVDAASVQALARRILSSKPTFAALGPLGRVESLENIRARLVL